MPTPKRCNGHIAAIHSALHTAEMSLIVLPRGRHEKKQPPTCDTTRIESTIHPKKVFGYNPVASPKADWPSVGGPGQKQCNLSADGGNSNLLALSPPRSTKTRQCRAPRPQRLESRRLIQRRGRLYMPMRSHEAGQQPQERPTANTLAEARESRWEA